MFSFSVFFLFLKSFFSRPGILSLCFVFGQGILRRVDPWDTWRRDLTIIASFLLYGTWGAGVRFVVCCKGIYVQCWLVAGKLGGRGRGWGVGGRNWCLQTHRFLSRDGDTILIPGTIFVLVSATFFSSFFVTWFLVGHSFIHRFLRSFTWDLCVKLVSLEIFIIFCYWCWE